MAVTATLTRTSHTDNVSTEMEFVTMTLAGTYVTGGFTIKPFVVAGGPGSSPLAGRTIRFANFQSPLGYMYVTSTAGTTMTIKIFSAAGVELANNTAVPDATVSGYLIKSKS